MNVLHIVGGDLRGGAARGAYLLHVGLRELGVESHILTNSKHRIADPNIKFTTGTTAGLLADSARRVIERQLRTMLGRNAAGTFSLGLPGFNFTKTDAYRRADIINLHWINGGFVDVKHLARVRKPVVWTLRDMWPLTGGCHHAMDCIRYQASCGSCPILGSHREHDLSSFVFKRKKAYLPEHLVVVGISRWMSEVARESSLLGHFPVHTVFNNISTRNFFPVQKRDARKALGVDPGRKIILIGSVNNQSIYKGYKDIVDLAERLAGSAYMLCSFGRGDLAPVRRTGVDCRDFGFLADTISLRLLYSCADVFVAPSHAEAFGKTLAEAMACGTPVVCYDATGPADIVTHKVDGYKATPFDSQSLADGVEWILHSNDYKSHCANARKKVIQQFDSAEIAKQYKELYHDFGSGQ